MNISENARDVLQEMFNTGLGHAVVAFSEMLEKEIHLSFPELSVFSFEELLNFMQKETSEDYVSVVQKFKSGVEGKGIVAFPVEDGKTMVNHLFRSLGSEELELGIVEKETILEVGNVLISAVVVAIGDIIEKEIALEMPTASITPDLAEMKESGEDMIYCVGQGNFGVEGIEIQGMILVIFSYTKIEHFLSQLDFI